MRVLSLFSGGGLGDFGLEKAGMEIAGQVEWDKYCQKILKLRWPNVPKWEDIQDVSGSEVIKKCGTIDIVAGGFPCQPFSLAGKRKGKEDERNMWPHMHRIISEIKPPWVLAENVRGIVKPYLDTVLSDLEGLDYSCLPLLIPASAIGAPHKRERLWILAYSRCKLQSRSIQQRTHGLENKKQDAHQPERPSEVGNPELYGPSSSQIQRIPRSAICNNKKRKDEASKLERTSPSRVLADTDKYDVQGEFKKGNGQEKWEEQDERPIGFSSGARQWAVEPNVGRVAHGVANRVDRLKLLGNGQVVQVVEWIGRMILEFDNVSELF